MKVAVATTVLTLAFVVECEGHSSGSSEIQLFLDHAIDHWNKLDQKDSVKTSMVLRTDWTS